MLLDNVTYIFSFTSHFYCELIRKDQIEIFINRLQLYSKRVDTTFRMKRSRLQKMVRLFYFQNSFLRNQLIFTFAFDSFKIIFLQLWSKPSLALIITAFTFNDMISNYVTTDSISPGDHFNASLDKIREELLFWDNQWIVTSY